ncbi:MAG: DUF2304 domain-containing protein [Hamadaea sp.]|uniref:DUF2304 domain-containing protein n=1 Tax=Hamadaea sp. TaxID=2024425 RepID=UPI0018391F15|nr:DUF2304 domain-containing protein [Hamadaea sp.]NUR74528.1 DUF2304 domain-containing protein [Hamadaea sp.]NUT18324.1 DUF2304 domain-containing protein [Hamadaea sp.]
MSLNVTTMICGLILLVGILELLRRRQLREKYGMLWIGVALVIVPLSIFPGLMDRVAGFVGVASGVSLVLFAAILFLLLVCLHLSWEVSRLEEETRTLAEEIALIKIKIDDTAKVGAQDDRG